MMQYKDKMCCTNTILYKIDKYVGQIMITAGRIEFPNHHDVTCDTTKKQTSSSHKSLRPSYSWTCCKKMMVTNNIQKTNKTTKDEKTRIRNISSQSQYWCLKLVVSWKTGGCLLDASTNGIKNLPKKPNHPTNFTSQESLNEGSGSVMVVDFAVDLIDLLSTSNFVLIWSKVWECKCLSPADGLVETSRQPLGLYDGEHMQTWSF